MLLILVALSLASEPVARGSAVAGPAPSGPPATVCMTGQLCEGRCIAWNEPCPLPLPPIATVPGLPDAFATCGAADPAPSAVLITHAVAGALCNTSSDATCAERASAVSSPTAPTCVTGTTPSRPRATQAGTAPAK
jgi:hypothetical protein